MPRNGSSFLLSTRILAHFAPYLVLGSTLLATDIDSGLRLYDGKRTVKIAGDSGAPASSYRMRSKDNSVGVVLVPPSIHLPQKHVFSRVAG